MTSTGPDAGSPEAAPAARPPRPKLFRRGWTFPRRRANGLVRPCPEGRRRRGRSRRATTPFIGSIPMASCASFSRRARPDLHALGGSRRNALCGHRPGRPALRGPRERAHESAPIARLDHGQILAFESDRRLRPASSWRRAIQSFAWPGSNRDTWRKARCSPERCAKRPAHQPLRRRTSGRPIARRRPPSPCKFDRSNVAEPRRHVVRIGGRADLTPRPARPMRPRPGSCSIGCELT